MLTFVTRRLVATILVLLVASFIVYILTAGSGDPLRELRGSRDPNAQDKIAYLSSVLNLDQPPVLRYFSWLGGVGACFIGQCDLGISVARGEQPVLEAIGGALGSTLQLVMAATILAIVIGVAIGMTTALRQYSGYDYVVTFLTFVFYSLPIFWVAVLLKEFGAIRFNEFLGNPSIPWWSMLVIGLVMGFIASSIVGGELRTRVISFVGVGGGVGVMLFLLDVTKWFSNPSIGFIGVALLTIAIAAIVLFTSTGFQHRRAVVAVSIVIGLTLALWYPMQFLFFYLNSGWTVLLVTVVMAGIGVVTGLLVGGDSKAVVARTAGIVGGLTVIPFVLEQMFLRWGEYVERIPLSNGVIATIGASTPAIRRVDDTWLNMLDSLTHMMLPTIALMIISLAAYTRYARASLLDVMNQDYVRTARAKGLGERTVVMRHAFRNAMIPIATIIALDFGAVIGGAVITERVFAWQAMGSLFNEGLNKTDVNLVMGFFLVTGVLAVLFNVFADILYSALDPRIRVS
ncbi:ABC transporter permease [Salinibacterium sp. M195]|uniref:ABC transporter permease n=1 Tax=Salinibacterium sp. M195 TaxID=2583374 RepID=UPI001C6258F8|nr:ABC transporter permease [Salinibacterium sp. M195]QYH36930.1 ABC transporter permease [Salinibacterium sp. M195]